jgi:hypothetical protein
MNIIKNNKKTSNKRLKIFLDKTEITVHNCNLNIFKNRQSRR